MKKIREKKVSENTFSLVARVANLEHLVRAHYENKPAASDFGGEDRSIRLNVAGSTTPVDPPIAVTTLEEILDSHRNENSRLDYVLQRVLRMQAKLFGGEGPLQSPVDTSTAQHTSFIQDYKLETSKQGLYINRLHSVLDEIETHIPK